MQINRLFEIVYILLHKKKVSASKLAEQLGVSRRTICRDIDILSLVGIPVYSEMGKSGGISLLPNFVLDKSLLSEQEQNEILTALHGLVNVKAGGTADVLRRLSSIFNKTSMDWLQVDFSEWSYFNDYFNVFKTAILERRITEFDYYNRYNQKTFRRIEPIQLWFKSKSWYVKGFCLTKQGIRLYKLSRVKSLVITEEHFSKRDLTTFIDNTSEIKNHKQAEIMIKIRITPEMAYRVYDEFDEKNIEKQDDGCFIVTVSWTEDNWVHGYILSFGEYAQVLEPKHLRETIANKIKKMSKEYYCSVTHCCHTSEAIIEKKQQKIKLQNGGIKND